jgi:hypothetical protein
MNSSKKVNLHNLIKNNNYNKNNRDSDNSDDDNDIDNNRSDNSDYDSDSDTDEEYEYEVNQKDMNSILENLIGDNKKTYIKPRKIYKLNTRKFYHYEYSTFIPHNKVSSEVKIGDIIHLIHRGLGYSYEQCIVDFIDEEECHIHKIDTNGFADKSYSFKHKNFLIFKMPNEFWKNMLNTHYNLSEHKSEFINSVKSHT